MKSKNLIYFSLMIILIFSLSNIANSATGLTYNYKAKTGESVSYTLSKFYFNGSQITTNQAIGSNNLTIQVGTDYTVTVCNVTGSNSADAYNPQKIFTKITYENQTTGCIYQNYLTGMYGDIGTQYVKAIANNKSYYSYLVGLNSNFPSYAYLSYLNGNIFTETGYFLNNNTFSVNSTDSWDLTNGWLINSTRISGYKNGTITSNIVIKSLGIPSFSNNGNTPGFDAIPVFSAFTLLALVVILKRK